jgi:hypothetical protein
MPWNTWFFRVPSRMHHIQPMWKWLLSSLPEICGQHKSRLYFTLILNTSPLFPISQILKAAWFASAIVWEEHGTNKGFCLPMWPMGDGCARDTQGRGRRPYWLSLGLQAQVEAGSLCFRCGLGFGFAASEAHVGLLPQQCPGWLLWFLPTAGSTDPEEAAKAEVSESSHLPLPSSLQQDF